MTFDHIVIGVGGMGSAAVCELARRGQRVLGLEQFEIAHANGSSHGLTRIIRLAYNEHPNYVPLLRRSYEMWRRLEADAGEELLVITGGLDLGASDSRVLTGALEACQQHDLAHEHLSTREIKSRYPAFNVPDGFEAVYQPDAGYLRPERCVTAHVAEARKMGAEIHERETVLGWEHRNETFIVKTDRATYEAPSLVVTAGPWASKLVSELGAVAKPMRQVVGWFQSSEPALFEVDRCPVFILDVEEGEYYGFPIDSRTPGFKLGRFHHLHEDLDPDAPRREPDAVDEEVIRRALRRYFPAADGPTSLIQACMFTMTPDRHFILDQHPEMPGLTIGAGFAGHGFKFASVIGEIMADLAAGGVTDHNIEMFSLKRFAS